MIGPNLGAAYVYSDEFARFDFGPGHPLRVQRLALAHQLITDCGLDAPALPAFPASDDQMATFHDRRYLDTLRELSESPVPPPFAMFGLGGKDNPVFPGVYEWAALSAGASLAAAELLLAGRPAVFSMAGGMHHAMAARASGFCYVNDINLAIMRLLAQGRRVVYIDLDAHHGDGVQWAFYGSDKVLCISLHQNPETLFPGSGVLEEIGRGQGVGFNVNIPLWPHTDDDLYVRAFEELVPPLVEAFRPDCVVSQTGVDSLMGDPLANLNLTTQGLGRCLLDLRQMAQGRWLALGGGGYDLANVARGWALAWAIISGQEDKLPEEMPKNFVQAHKLGRDRRMLLDPPGALRGRYWPRAAEEAKSSIKFVREKVFPLLGAKG
ncbi:Histone deacetylase [Desulfarculus baarsii DSM 2075]|uniref:Acetoin utilization protein AcuC n=1 Tax=Desulfarculus baarsii (strain ATCC 33931 / DSM 2075 / LMG 7858 / VKM B-1802 / 2st14) TaxID=644282 RepID=E1QG35_DESB2|nr:acetoin utilization protein AcuC [Desulfarculus baarsii]ADK84645.1 Histone deacetylase [Desulfarculus baarsii DSM 2075]